jgi:hypothetical protein
MATIKLGLELVFAYSDPVQGHPMVAPGRQGWLQASCSAHFTLKVHDFFLEELEQF